MQFVCNICAGLHIIKKKMFNGKHLSTIPVSSTLTMEFYNITVADTKERNDNNSN